MQGSCRATKPSATFTVRISSALPTSSNGSNYDNREGIRVLQETDADIVLIQQFVYTADFTTIALGRVSVFHRGSGQFSTGILSRYLVVFSGECVDPTLTNRTFSWAKLDIPGLKFL